MTLPATQPISFGSCASADAPVASISVMAIAASLNYRRQGCRPRQRFVFILPTAHLQQNTERLAFRVLYIVTLREHSVSVTSIVLAACLIFRFSRRMIRVS